MDIICFPFERVIEINAFILKTEKGMKGPADLAKLQYEAHSLKGCAGSMGFPGITQLAAELELAARSQDTKVCQLILQRMQQELASRPSGVTIE